MWSTIAIFFANSLIFLFTCAIRFRENVLIFLLYSIVSFLSASECGVPSPFSLQTLSFSSLPTLSLPEKRYLSCNSGKSFFSFNSCPSFFPCIVHVEYHHHSLCKLSFCFHLHSPIPRKGIFFSPHVEHHAFIFDFFFKKSACPCGEPTPSNSENFFWVYVHVVYQRVCKEKGAALNIHSKKSQNGLSLFFFFWVYLHVEHQRVCKENGARLDIHSQKTQSWLCLFFLSECPRGAPFSLQSRFAILFANYFIFLFTYAIRFRENVFIFLLYSIVSMSTWSTKEFAKTVYVVQWSTKECHWTLEHQRVSLDFGAPKSVTGLWSTKECHWLLWSTKECMSSSGAPNGLQRQFHTIKLGGDRRVWPEVLQRQWCSTRRHTLAKKLRIGALFFFWSVCPRGAPFSLQSRFAIPFANYFILPSHSENLFFWVYVHVEHQRVCKDNGAPLDIHSKKWHTSIIFQECIVFQELLSRNESCHTKNLRNESCHAKNLRSDTCCTKNLLVHIYSFFGCSLLGPLST